MADAAASGRRQYPGGRGEAARVVGGLLTAAAGGGWEVPAAGEGRSPEQTSLVVPPSPHPVQPWQAALSLWRHSVVESRARPKTWTRSVDTFQISSVGKQYPLGLRGPPPPLDCLESAPPLVPWDLASKRQGTS